ncbi:hypothetical protein C3Y08_01840 [Burkholderia gladioli]|uniref:hypothetical protein n=1 Tax=Burkholderia gladioli TaxID=28095 RepID=UPI000CDACCB9|nr:hypothetical protein [Burkholderia gladioli]POS10213.1 hypothetical protein C3Y08_01840 [Burkholderia gladioli]
MNLVQLAGMLPRDATFRAYLCDLASVDDVTTETAEIWVRTICEVESRRELATDAAAAHRFETLVRRPFVAWRRNQQH